MGPPSVPACRRGDCDLGPESLGRGRGGALFCTPTAGPKVRWLRAKVRSTAGREQEGAHCPHSALDTESERPQCPGAKSPVAQGKAPKKQLGGARACYPSFHPARGQCEDRWHCPSENGRLQMAVLLSLASAPPPHWAPGAPPCHPLAGLLWVRARQEHRDSGLRNSPPTRRWWPDRGPPVTCRTKGLDVGVRKGGRHRPEQPRPPEQCPGPISQSLSHHRTPRGGLCSPPRGTP